MVTHIVYSYRNRKYKFYKYVMVMLKTAVLKKIFYVVLNQNVNLIGHCQIITHLTKMVKLCTD